MCVQDVRKCETCGWQRPWNWHKCDTYLQDEIAACAKGERSYRHEDCPNTKEHHQTNGSPWPLKCPALQCGNPECPEKVRAQDVRRKVEQRKQRQVEELEQWKQMRKEAREQKAERFSRRYFVKQPVLSVEEQMRELDERINAAEES